MKRWIWTLGSLALALPVLGSTASAQPMCPPGVEFCVEPAPCYRTPDDPECNPDCHCGAENYPECDPYCAPGDAFCDPDCGNPCYEPEFSGGDVCSDPPPPCEPMGERPFEFIDDMDGDDNGQIFALGNRDPMRSCGTLLVDETGYYSIFDTELSESCNDQRDETGYLTISNSCNSDGWAAERNAEDRFLVFDSDNTTVCDTDADCGAGLVCREGTSHGNCCVPEEPVFMGTFLLVAGEPNTICINHWCPDWSAEIEAGRDFGFVVDGCEGVNSIHFRIDATAIACKDETTLNPCSWGCFDGECAPDPCDAADCPAYCMDGECLDENPCAGITCEHGCVRGRCLQNRHARGFDRDMDGFSDVADCDDGDPLVNPDREEICGNGVDDNCDGFYDERPCTGADEVDGGVAMPRDGGLDPGPGPGVGGGSATGGCGCRTTDAGDAGFALIMLAFFMRRRDRL